MKTPLSAIVVLLASSILRAGPQNASAPGPAFEVASVKRSPPPGPEGIFSLGGIRKRNSWNATNVTLRMLVRSAYGPRYQMEGQMIGGPAWFDTARFDIAARIAGTASNEDVWAMVRALLADRFKLVTHSETRELPVYVLTTARSDGKLGEQMRPAAVDCNELREARRRGEAPPPPPYIRGAPPPPCRTMTTVQIDLSRIESGGVTTVELVRTLSQFVRRPIIDRTGLTGHFAMKLEFASEVDVSSAAPSVAGAPPGAPAGADLPSVFAALQEVSSSSRVVNRQRC